MKNLKAVFHTKDYSLADTLNCGQCFRFRDNGDGSFTGTARGITLTLLQDGDDVRVSADSASDLSWTESYFGMNDSYKEINRILSRDPTLAMMMKDCGKLRIMHQDFWEVFLSFIVSQNNNIPRIMAIIERLCENFGERSGTGYAFPTPERMASLSEEDLAVLRCGYRVPYIIDASRKFLSGEILEKDIRTLPLDEARNRLLTVKGVGPKVADCTLLFGACRLEAFPKDVWIRKAMAEYFPEGLPDFAKPYAGIAQQYMFHYLRNLHREN